MWWDKKPALDEASTVAQGIYTVSDTTTAAPWTVPDITWNYPNAVPTMTSPNTAPTWTISPGGGGGTGWIHNPPPPNKIKLQGEDADIEINGRSLRRVLQALEQRLLLLTPNAELEAEWDQLRELGEQYRALEADLQAKSEMWRRLRSE